jgi:hypothetical protein
MKFSGGPMTEIRKYSAPDWAAIFAERPDLEAPGYQEALQAVRDKKNQAETERIRAQMQEILKQKNSTKNKARTQARRKSTRTE